MNIRRTSGDKIVHRASKITVSGETEAIYYKDDRGALGLYPGDKIILQTCTIEAAARSTRYIIEILGVSLEKEPMLLGNMKLYNLCMVCIGTVIVRLPKKELLSDGKLIPIAFMCRNPSSYFASIQQVEVS